MKDAMAALRAFHEAFGVPVGERPAFPSADRRALRLRLLDEEYNELLTAEGANDLVEVADALADLVVIICGTAWEYGIPLAEVFAEVMRTNMAKLGPNGRPIVREDGKLLKPAGWTPPDVAGVLAGRA